MSRSEQDHRAKVLMLVLGLCFVMLVSTALGVGAFTTAFPELGAILIVVALACAFTVGVVVGIELERT